MSGKVDECGGDGEWVWYKHFQGMHVCNTSTTLVL